MNHRSKNRASRSAFGASSKRKADCRGRRVGGFAGSCFIRTGLAIAASAALPLSGTAAEAEPAEAAVDSAAAPASLPPFLFEPFYADNRGSVYGVYEARHADLVLVRGGFDTGLRDGMICEVVDQGTLVGEILLAGVRDTCAAALILGLEEGKVIEAGHTVQVKVIRF